MTAVMQRIAVALPGRDLSGHAMDELTTRVLACPRCGGLAAAELSWNPKTAWRARVRSYKCSNGCSVHAEVVLRNLGFEVPRRTQD
jgi:hypothetical protein